MDRSTVQVIFFSFCSRLRCLLNIVAEKMKVLIGVDASETAEKAFNCKYKLY